jgi:hypothetical protein
LNKNASALEFLHTKITPEVATTAILGDFEIFRNNSTAIANPREFYPVCAFAGRLDIFKEAEAQGLAWRQGGNFFAAVYAGHVELLTWLLEHNPPNVARGKLLLDMGQISAELGNLNTLKWLSGFPEFTWTEEITMHAAMGGHVEILEYVRENGLPIDLLQVCEGAAKGTGFIPWNEGNLQVLKWAREKKGTWDFFSRELVIAACHRKDHKILRWLLIHGYVLPEHEDIFHFWFGTWSEGKMEKDEFLKIKKSCA